MTELILVGFMLVIFALVFIGAFGLMLRYLFQAGTSPAVTPQPESGPILQSDWLDDLTTTERVLARLFTDGKLQTGVFEAIKRVLTTERVRVTQPKPSDDPIDVKIPPKPVVVSHQTVVTSRPALPEPSIVPWVEPVPQQVVAVPATPTKPKASRRSFTEVLNSFMEESNIRWGEIVGGLLIIGCSTALVVSLWSQISEIPVLKFLIFTTVTAVLFGIGMYTEHRWKLPTTSRGILTIATLLVPLNFLAIAAVSSSAASGVLILGSELLAPAIFLCLVYFAGRIITPGFAHVLSAGILGSSIGQILVRHVASTEASPEILVFLGAFPVVCYVVAIGFVLQRMLLGQEIDETETTTLFTVLGTMSFAALLPFGLLLYKAGPFWMTMMYLAPLVTLAGVPMLATGTVLWKRIQDEKLITSRTAGTAIGVIGLIVVVAGMVLAWPNPASVVVAALLGVAIFTALAIALELPAAHLLAAGCFSQACLVSFHVVAGNIRWQNLRVESLLHTTLQISSGYGLTGVCAILLITAELLTRKEKVREGYFYLVGACVIGALSLFTVTLFGPVLGFELPTVWIVYALFAFFALWLSWRHRSVESAWIGIALLLFANASAFAWNTTFSFPWQTALLVHATFCSISAILSRRAGLGILWKPLSYAGLISCVLGAVSMFQTNPWQVTSMQAERVFWISGIMLVSMWLNRRLALLVSLQIGLTAGVILSVKAALQQYEWYTYLPHAFLHPVGLQIQGAMLALLGLAWIATRFLIKRLASDGNTQLKELWCLLDAKYSVDQIVTWILVTCFALLAVYSAMSGLAHEFAMFGPDYQGWNIAGFPHQEAYSIGSWIVMGLLLLNMLASAWERRKHVYVLGAVLVGSAVVPLLAARFEDQLATATGWRFLAAAFLIVGSVFIWQRNKVRDLLRSFEWPALELDTDQLALRLRYLCLLLAAGPILLLTIYPSLRLVFQATVNTPTFGLFSTFDHGQLYAVPLVATALVLIGYAIREREPQFAFWAGLLFNLTVTLSFVLAVITANAPLDETVVVTAIQLNIITFAVYALLWLSLRHLWTRVLSTRSASADKLLKLITQLAAIPGLGILSTFVLNLIITNLSGVASAESASLLGWFALVVTVLSYALGKTVQRIEFSASELAATLVSILCLMTFGLSDVVQLRVLTLGLVLIAWMMFGATTLKQSKLAIRLNESWTHTSQRLSVWIGAVAVLLGIRLLPILTSSENWWPISTFVMLSVLAGLLNWHTLKRKYIYASGMLLNLAVTVWYLLDPKTGFGLYELNIFVAGLAGVMYLAMELRARKLSNTKSRVGWSYHHIVLSVSPVLLLLITWVYFLVGSEEQIEIRPWSWLALLSIGALMFAALWDRHARYAVSGLYLLGLLAGAMALQQLQVYDQNLVWASTIILSVYSVAVSFIWRQRSSLYSMAEKWKVPLRLESSATDLWWLSTFSTIAVVLIAVSAYAMNVISFSFGQRITGAIALMVQSLTLSLISAGPSRKIWQRASVACVLVGAVLLCWAWLTPGLNDTWLNRSVIMMVLSFVLAGIYTVGIKKIRPQHWADAIQSCIPSVIGMGLLAVAFCLCTELIYKLNFGEVRVSPVSLVAIGTTLLAAIFIAILFALRSDYDPLSLSEHGRMGYVYAAEVLLGLLFLHVRLTMPWLFTGFFERYWPLVVMAIAYIGVTSSEWLRRREVHVVSKPLTRTGAFLPLLPVLGFWIAASEVDYSSLLFVVGGLYGLLSVMRKSLLFGVLAAVAGNAGLWHLLERTDGYQFVQHPQMFLIPAAASVLIAAYLNEDRLSEEQMAGARYLSLVAIYASSTADIFINGVENSPWLPLVLGGLSLTGVLAGIMLRIRGMLLLGSVFLLLSITTMIWYASANYGWTWLWYVAGIATGASIIFMFALFEKKRTEVLRVVEGFREWEV